MKKITFILVITLLLFAGCSRVPWVIKSDPPVHKIDNSLYTIELTPSAASNYSYRAFDLAIYNKTDKDIELIWDRTYYLQNGQTNGGFLFEGVIIRDRNLSKPPDIIFPQKTFRKTIYPNVLASFDKYWYYDTLPNGENGIYLSLKSQNVEIREKLTVNIFAGYDESQRYQTGLGEVFQKIEK